MSIVARQGSELAPPTVSAPHASTGGRLHSAPAPGPHAAPGAPPWTRARRPLAFVLGDLVLPCLAAVGAAAVPGLATGASLPALLVVALLWPLLLAPAGWYAARPAGSERLLPLAVLLAALGWVLVRALPASLVGGPAPDAASEAVALVAAAAAVGTRAVRCVHGGWCTHRGLPRSGTPRHAVLVGHPAATRHLADRLAGSADLTVTGTCLHEEPGAPDHPARHRQPTAPGAPTVVGLPRLADLLDWTGADLVVVLPCSHLEGPTLRRLGWELEERGTDLVLATGLTGVAPARTRVGVAGDLPVVHVRPARLRGPARLVKEVWERTAATLALVLLAPLLVALMVAVRLDSRGPALFRQARVGRGEQPFTMWKLRTMSTDAERRRVELSTQNEAGEVLFKIREDPRVTRLGRVLRRTSLDELPQLVNIVLGQMSLVGPRPALPHEVAEYAPDVRRRLVVKPGLTGLWQVSGRSDLSWEESVRLDQHYVDNWSLRTDLAIVARTAHAVLGRRGAY